jgi:CheY-like chemotaxis protein
VTNKEWREFIEEDGYRKPGLWLSEGWDWVQSTPLLSRNGAPLGGLSTHHRKPHRPSERDPPTLVLLDMHLPLMDGPEVVQELHARHIDIPFVVMTAAQDARRWAQEVNADGFIAKPFHLLELLDSVEKYHSGK